MKTRTSTKKPTSTAPNMAPRIGQKTAHRRHGDGLAGEHLSSVGPEITVENLFPTYHLGEYGIMDPDRAEDPNWLHNKLARRKPAGGSENPGEKPDDETAAGKLIQRMEATKENPDEETATGKLIQQEVATEEKPDEETVAGKLIQREEATEEKPDEETAAGKLIQREEATEEKPDEETAAGKLIQREETPEEKPDDETAAGKLIQREESEEKPDEEVNQKPTGIQTKLKIGAPNDAYEQEADKKADEVMRMPDPLVQRMGQEESEEKSDEETATGKLIQREEAPEEKPDEETAAGKLIQREEVPEEKPDEETATGKLIQREETPEEKPDEETAAGKLIQREEVPEEKPDEDTAAGKFIQREETPEEKSDEETASGKLIQRMEESENKEEDEVNASPLFLRAKSSQNDPRPVNEIAAGNIQTLRRGGGHPLSGSERAFFEPRFQRDFGKVRLHTDENAARASASVNARAFTLGRDVFFNKGEYNPGTDDGKKLMAHELTHTVQQGQTIRKKFQLKANRTDPHTLWHSAEKSPTSGAVSTGSVLSRLEEKVQRKMAPESQTEDDSKDQNPEEEEKKREEESGAGGTAVGEQSASTGRDATTAPEEATVAVLVKAPENEAPAKPGASSEQDTAEKENKETDAEPEKPEESEKTQAEKEGTGSAPQAVIAGTEKGESASNQPEGNAPEATEEGGGAQETVPDKDAGENAEQPGQDGEKQESGGEAGGEIAPTRPEDDPAYQAVVGRIDQIAENERAHASADRKANEARSAAQGPANEVSSQAQARQVGVMSAQKPGTFDRKSFKEQLLQKIKSIAPKNLDAADKFKDSGKLDGVKGDLSQQTGANQKKAQKNIEQTAKAKPNTSGLKPKPVTPLPQPKPGPEPKLAGAQNAAPKPKTDAEVSLDEGSQKLDNQMKNAGVTEEQLEKSNEPSFKEGLTAKKSAQKDAQTAPGEFRKDEKKILDKSKTEATETSHQQLKGMHSGRIQMFRKIFSQQHQGKGKDESKRAEVSGKIQAIYEEAKVGVENELKSLDDKVNTTFDSGAKTAQDVFENYVDRRMSAYKAKRYSGLDGAGRWLSDLFMGLPDEVNVFYMEGRQLYINRMDGVIDRVIDVIAKGLTSARNKIKEGKKKIQDYVRGLPGSLRRFGMQEARKIQSKFDELENSVNEKQNELIDTLAKKYSENVQKVDDRIKEMKEANKGLVDKAFGAIAGIIQTILELKNKLMSILAKAGDVIGTIISAPITFLGNLISALTQGFNNFVGNIKNYLISGLINWLTGSLGSTGITLPEKFDLPGIFSLVLQILGLGWDFLRKKAIKLLGEPVVKAMETGLEMFKILKEGGPGALWSYVKEQFSNLKEMVMGEIQNMIITEVIKAGVKWILGLLSPAGAFIKAAMAIYDIVKFFIDRGSQIIALVEAIMSSISAIAKGQISAAAKFVEESLGKAIPVIIGFLASLLGISGLVKRVQGIIGKIRGKIEGAVDKVLMKIKKMAGKFLRKVKGKKKGKEEQEREKKEKNRKDSISFSINKPLKMSTEGHKLTANATKGKLNFVIASNTEDFLLALKNAIVEAKQSNRSEKTKLEHDHTLRMFLKSTEEIIYDYNINDSKILKNKPKTLSAEKEAKSQYIKQRTAEIANALEVFAKDAGIKSLDDFYKAPPKERYIPGYPDQGAVGKFIRQKLYDRLGWRSVRLKVAYEEKEKLINKIKSVQASKDSKMWDGLIRKGLVEKGADINSYNSGKINYEVDHIEPLTKRWNDKGYNSDDNLRLEQLSERENLRFVTRQYNRSKGSGSLIYKQYVGESFTSKFAEGGLKGALRIGGKSFVDASGKPLEQS